MSLRTTLCGLLLTALSQTLLADPTRYGAISKPTCSFEYKYESALHIEKHYQELLTPESEYATYRLRYGDGFMLVSLVNNQGQYTLSLHANNNGKTLTATIEPAIGESFFKALRQVDTLHYIDRSTIVKNYVVSGRPRPCAIVGIKTAGQPLIQGGMNIAPDSTKNRFIYEIPYTFEGLNVLFDEKTISWTPWIDENDYPATKIYAFLETLVYAYRPDYRPHMSVPFLTDRGISPGDRNLFPELKVKSP